LLQINSLYCFHVRVDLRTAVTECHGTDCLLICFYIQKRFEGTRVTIETFLAWKVKFDSELAELQRQKGKDDVTNKKLTGAN